MIHFERKTKYLLLWWVWRRKNYEWAPQFDAANRVFLFIRYCIFANPPLSLSLSLCLSASLPVSIVKSIHVTKRYYYSDKCVEWYYKCDLNTWTHAYDTKIMRILCFECHSLKIETMEERREKFRFSIWTLQFASFHNFADSSFLRLIDRNNNTTAK